MLNHSDQFLVPQRSSRDRWTRRVGILFLVGIICFGIILLSTRAKMSESWLPRLFHLASDLPGAFNQKMQPENGNELEKSLTGAQPEPVGDDFGLMAADEAITPQPVPIVAATATTEAATTTTEAATTTTEATTTTTEATTTTTEATTTTTKVATTALGQVEKLVSFANVSVEGSLMIPATFHLPAEFCEGLKRIVVVIKSQAHNVHIREKKRKELASYPEWVRADVSLAFVLGRPANSGSHSTVSEAERAMMDEASEKKDMMIGNFLDIYQNLSFKSIFAVKVLYEECQLANEIAALGDEDVAINFAGMRNDLVYILDEVKKRKKTVYSDSTIWAGARYAGSKVIHDPKSKNYENLTIDWFPVYVSGICNIFNRETGLLFLHRRRSDSHHYFNDDAMFGVLVEADGVNVIDLKHLIVFDNPSYRKTACKGSITSKSITECDCHRWWAYQCHIHESDEYDKAVAVARECQINKDENSQIGLPEKDDLKIFIP